MKYFLPIACCLLTVACQYNPFAHRFLTREPSPDEVVGTYALHEVYVDMVEAGLSERIRKASPPPSITLHANGTAVLKQFPLFEELDDSFDYKFIDFEDLDARWEISSAGSVSSGGDDLKTAYGLRLTLSDGRSLLDPPTLTGETEVDGLIFTFYDGDQGQILGYQKTAATPDPGR